MTTRGIRNNNPGNIRHGAGWQGMADEQPDPAFITFKTPEYGIRAIARIMLTYAKNGIVNVRGIISRWAPDNENNTEAYIASVCEALKVNPDQYIDLTVEMPALVKAIIRQENGLQPYSDETIEAGIALV